MNVFQKHNRGFTLIELLVVVAIIGVLASVVLSSINSARDRAEDTRRMEDMRQIRIALEQFHQDNGRYPDFANEGIPNSGQCIGIGQEIDTALTPYLSQPPNDPRYDAGGCSPGEVAVATYYYAYDPVHPVDFCNGDSSDDITNGVVFGFFTASAIGSSFAKDTCSGNINMKFDTAVFNQAVTN